MPATIACITLCSSCDTGNRSKMRRLTVDPPAMAAKSARSFHKQHRLTPRGSGSGATETKSLSTDRQSDLHTERSPNSVQQV